MGKFGCVENSVSKEYIIITMMKSRKNEILQ